MYVLGFISLVLAPFTSITIIGAAAFFIIGYISEKREKQRKSEILKEVHIENDEFEAPEQSRNQENFAAPLEPELSTSKKIPAASYISEDRLRLRRASKNILDQAEAGFRKIDSQLKFDGKFCPKEVNLFLHVAEIMPISEDDYDEEEIRLFISIYYKILGYESTFSKFQDADIWYDEKLDSLLSDENYFFLFFLLMGRLEGVTHLICENSGISEDLAEIDIRKIMVLLGQALENVKINGSELETYFAKDLLVQIYEILVEKFRSKGFYKCASLLTG